MHIAHYPQKPTLESINGQRACQQPQILQYAEIKIRQLTKCKTAIVAKRAYIVCTERCRQLAQTSKIEKDS